MDRIEPFRTEQRTDALIWYPYIILGLRCDLFYPILVWTLQYSMTHVTFIEYLLIWTSCMYNVHCTSRCMFLWKYTMNTYDKYVRKYASLRYRMFFYFGQVHRNQNWKWSHNLGSILHCYVLLTYNSATAGPNFVIGLYFYDFGRFDHNKRTFYNVNLHIWAQNLDKMYDEIRNQILGYNKR